MMMGMVMLLLKKMERESAEKGLINKMKVDIFRLKDAFHGYDFPQVSTQRGSWFRRFFPSFQVFRKFYSALRDKLG